MSLSSSLTCWKFNLAGRAIVSNFFGDSLRYLKISPNFSKSVWALVLLLPLAAMVFSVLLNCLLREANLFSSSSSFIPESSSSSTSSSASFISLLAAASEGASSSSIKPTIKSEILFSPFLVNL